MFTENLLNNFGVYKTIDQPSKAYKRFSEVLRDIPDPVIDNVGLVEFIARGYFFSDRTLLKDATKTRWDHFHSKPHEVFLQARSRPSDFVDPKQIAMQLKESLCAELLEFCNKKKRIILPLSGGMDSRVVAAVIRSLIDTKDLGVEVVAFTWGTSCSRDVRYASEIARLLKFEWMHVELSPEDLYKNIAISAANGLEYSPLHLHGAHYLRSLKGYDGIVVSSYGDSIGRGRYSGRHISSLRMFSEIIDRYGLIEPRGIVAIRAELNKDLYVFRNSQDFRGGGCDEEINYQGHYMYRLINSVWAYVNEELEVFQAFTSKAVVEYMLNLSPASRSDWPYFHILDSLNKELLSVPWSATGGLYPNGRSRDKYKNFVAPYGSWTRSELYGEIVKLINTSSLIEHPLFSRGAIASLLAYLKRHEIEEANYKTELALWFASFAVFLGNNKAVFNTDNLDFNRNRSLRHKFRVSTYEFALRSKTKLNSLL